MSLLDRVFGRRQVVDPQKILPAKDPLDFRLTPSSEPWETERYCKSCFEQVVHGERMANICNSCGGACGGVFAPTRSYRKIWNGSKWVLQEKYPHGYAPTREQRPNVVITVPK